MYLIPINTLWLLKNIILDLRLINITVIILVWLKILVFKFFMNFILTIYYYFN